MTTIWRRNRTAFCITTIAGLTAAPARADLVYNAGVYSAPIVASPGSNTTVTLGSPLSIQTSSSAHVGFTLTNTSNTPQANTNDILFNLNNLIAVNAATADSTDAYAGLSLFSQGGPGVSGKADDDIFGNNAVAPKPGGVAGGFTINTSSTTVRLTANAVSSAAPLYGIYAKVQSSDGGGSDAIGGQPDAGAFANFANAINANIRDVTVSVDTGTASTGAALYFLQQGGTGGRGGQGSGNTYSPGGSGGTANLQTVTIAGSDISATGGSLGAVYLRQVGGNGGDGLNGITRSSGGGGAPGKGVTLQLGDSTNLSTTGTSAPAVRIEVVGGAGGIGSSDSGISANGGNGGNGASNSNGAIAGLTDLATNVGVFTSGAVRITTAGANSAGLLVSDKGGNGGASRDLDTDFGAVSGNGGSGGNGGNITVRLASGATITTGAASSPAISLLTQGGAGGVAGTGAGGLGGGSSGNGGNGGGSGAINLTIDPGTILSTTGDASHGVFVQARGGVGGLANRAAGVFVTNGGSGGSGGSTQAISVNAAGSIATTSDSARGIFAQSHSGTGGSGANSDGVVDNSSGGGGNSGSVGAITVANTGSITTTGPGAQGILAQSLGGTGGTGGSGSGSFFADGGNGGSSASTNAGSVNVSTSGSIRTTGSVAAAILAQSLGGGGGDGGAASGVFYGDSGAGGQGGNGAAVAVSLGGELTTGGQLSHGAIAQSIGGGGGNGGNTTVAGTVASYAVGAGAGGGGSGGVVSVTAQGTGITTSGTGAGGIVAQSVGGGGGTGGSAFANSAGSTFAFAAAIGGSGGTGGSGQGVTVNLGNATILTGGTGQIPPPAVKSKLVLAVDSIGILAQSIGGGGGAGGGASAQATAVSLPAPPEGPKTIAVAATYSAGGSGGAAGSGGTVTLNLANSAQGTAGGATIATAGPGAHGALAQSIGGGGGQGGDSSSLAGTVGSTSLYGALAGDTISVTVGVAVGGRASAGAGGGAVTVNGGGAGTPLNVTTTGDYAYGLAAQSVGGGGGNAGVGSATYTYSGKTENHNLTIGVGSQGGGGGNGGAVTVNLANTLNLRTSGSGAIGVVAQSVGGGGGISTGGTVGLGDLASFARSKTSRVTFTVRTDVSIGATGGTGGGAGTVALNNQGTITTVGNDAPGIVAQSIGGGGGIGGSAGNDAAEGGDSTEAAAAASVKQSSTASPKLDVQNGNPFNPNLTVETSLGLNLGGKGGAAGNGNTVLLQNGGTVTTSGDYAPGLMAQSIGGGGGRGGVAAGGGEGNSLSSIVGTGAVTANLTLGASGGSGSGGTGGAVTVNLDGGATIVTGRPGQGSLGTGFQSIGVLAQSIGGGGGLAADGTVQPIGVYSLGAGLAGVGGATGDGGAVTLNQSSCGCSINIQTAGGSAHGIVLQSIGAGGGVAGVGSSVSPGLFQYTTTAKISLGGSVGSVGSGGSVMVNSPILNIATSGLGAYGLVAQSIGGGGGLASVVGTTTQLGTFGGNGATGQGGTVSVSLNPDSRISTSGLGAHAIIAQSVGGGGGILGAYQAGVTPALVNPPPVNNNGGGGGSSTVTVNAAGSILTTGAGAFGVIAQSVARGGGLVTIGANSYAATLGNPAASSAIAGPVNVNVQGSISATGENAAGVFAQSTNGQGVGSGTVTVNVGPTPTSATAVPGVVIGGGGSQGTGVWVGDGNSNNSINVAAGSSIAAGSNKAINYTGGFGVNVTNSGSIAGSIIAGHGTVTNNGTLSAGAGQAVIAADALVLTPNSRLTVNADFARGTSGSFLVQGDATLAGQVRPVFATILANVRVPVLTVTGATSGTLTVPDSPLFGYQVQQTGNAYTLAATSSRFADARFGQTAGRAAVAGYLDRVFQTTSNPVLGSYFAALDAFAGTQPAAYNRGLNQASPRSATSIGSQRAVDGAWIANASMSCPVFSGPTSFLTEAGCVYVRAGGRTTTEGGDADRGSLRLDSATWQLGGQVELSPGWFLGGSLAYETTWLQSGDGVKGRGNSGHGAITLKRQEGPWLLTAAVFGSTGGFDIQRVIDIPANAGVAKGSPTQTSVGGRIRAAYTIGTDPLYVRPYVNVDIIHARSGAYDEYGVNTFGLHVDAAEQTTAVITPAVEVGIRRQLGAGIVLRSYVAAGVDIRSNTDWKGSARFLGAPLAAGTFATTAQQSRAAARITTGLQLFSGDRIDLRAQYDGSYAARANTHGGTLTFAYRL